MSFNTALSGIRAASTDLEVSGNNIANASTAGFKRSRAEFADVFASSVVGSSGSTPGSGVLVSDVSQQFGQGNISFTDNSLDLAINGSGFFIMDDGGSPSYTRSGIFGTDKDGFIVDNGTRRLQGFEADQDGNIIAGVLTDLQVDTSNQAPRQTTGVNTNVNVNATDSAPERLVTTTDGTGVVLTPVAGTANGYDAGSLDVVTATGSTTLDIGTVVGADPTARQIANEINTQAQSNNLGISASAHTQTRLEPVSADFTGFAGGDLTLTISPGGGAPALGSIDILALGNTPTDIAQAINEAQIAGVSAVINPAGNGVDITAANGEDIVINNANAGAENVTMQGLSAATGTLTPTVPLFTLTVAAGNNDGVIGGEVDIVVPDSTAVQATVADPGTVFGNLAGNSSNTFEPTDPTTYNSATSVTIYDSLGNSHTMTQYFVKERTDPQNLGTTTNTWSMYVQIDGQDVGDPAPGNTAPGRAQYTMRYQADGSLDPSFDGPYLISNWTPSDADGNYNGALLPQSVAGGGILPIPDPVTSSNFEIDIAGSTQFGSPFGVASNQQNGFSTGQLIGLDIDQGGILFARFSNGQSQVLGQLALADFPNPQGLQPVGDSQWVESFTSGQPNVGTPGTTALGLLQSGALEESNVDLSEELVNLIIAQRNYQANAKTIETANQVTQTIINLR